MTERYEVRQHPRTGGGYIVYDTALQENAAYKSSGVQLTYSLRQSAATAAHHLNVMEKS